MFNEVHMENTGLDIDDEDFDLDEQCRQEFSARVQRMIELFELEDQVRMPA